MSETIEQKLDRLAEFHAQRDSIGAQKRALLDDVKVPAEIQALVSDSMRRMAEAEKQFHPEADVLTAKINAEFDAVVIPEEIKTALAEIDAKRQEIAAKHQAGRDEIAKKLCHAQDAIRDEVERQTEKVYADLAAKKNEIEAEFWSKEKDAEANIAKLEAEIRADVIARAAEKLKEDLEADDLSVKGSAFHAVYSRGRITWEAKKLDKLPRKLAACTVEIDSFVAMTKELASLRKRISEIAWALLDARKEGDPSVALRAIGK